MPSLQRVESQVAALTGVRNKTLLKQANTLQQQLARVQITLERAHNDHKSTVDIRRQEEELLHNLTLNNTEEAALIDEHKKQQKTYAVELSTLRETIQQIES